MIGNSHQRNNPGRALVARRLSEHETEAAFFIVSLRECLLHDLKSVIRALTDTKLTPEHLLALLGDGSQRASRVAHLDVRVTAKGTLLL